MEKKNNKGEAMTVSTVIGIIIVVLGLALLLFILYQFAWDRNVDREACHQSVILRGSLPSLAEQYVPLKCKTEKICITSKLFGGNCTAEYGDLKGVTKVRVSSVTAVEKTLAENVVDCWSTLGEGKVNLFSQKIAKDYGLSVVGAESTAVYPTCIICSRVAFDEESLKNSGIDIKSIDLVKYMQTHAVPGKEISYYDYIIGQNAGKVSVSDNLMLPGLIGDNVTGDNVNSQLEILNIEEEKKKQESDYNLQNAELAVLFMQISAPKYLDSAQNLAKDGALLTLGTGAVFGPVKTVQAGGRALSFAGKACTKIPIVCGAVAVIAGAYQPASVAYNRAITAGYCGDVSTGSEARDGCSVVRTVNYNEADIKQYCGVIESIP